MKDFDKLAFLIGYREIMEKVAATPFAMMGQMLQQARPTTPGAVPATPNAATTTPAASNPAATARARSQVSQAIRGTNMPFMGNVGQAISTARGNQAAQSLNAAARPAAPQGAGNSGYTTRGQAGMQDDRILPVGQ
jgi:hypothetical protein